MLRKIWLALSLCAVAIPTQVHAVGNSWYGGEVQANQSPGRYGFGYGRYAITLKPSTGAGTITGFFNLCYGKNLSNGKYTDCVLYTQSGDPSHFEVDALEFTPTGPADMPSRRWIDTCLSNNSCQISFETNPPRTNDGSLKGVSYNTFSPDNQVYKYLTPGNFYAGYHTYRIDVLPDRIVWFVDGTRVLSRTDNPGFPMRNYSPYYKRFDKLLRNGQVKLIINVWDGTQGSQGGFGGPSSTVQTTGQPAQIEKVAFYPLQDMGCQPQDCTFAAKPSFLTDLTDPDQPKFVRDNKPVDLHNQLDFCTSFKPTESNDACTPSNGKTNANTMWCAIQRNDFPVYTSPSHVRCDATKNMTLCITPNEGGRCP